MKFFEEPKISVAKLQTEDIMLVSYLSEIHDLDIDTSLEILDI